MTIIKQFVKLLIVTATFFCGTLSAENEYAYTVDGIIDSVQLNKNTLVIEDEIFEVATYAKVHANSKYPGVYVFGNLRQNMNIGIKLEPVGNKSKVITEIWLLD